MIKTGIVGGETQIAGELIRLLVLHPDVELECVYAPHLKGKSLSSFHRGLKGDTTLKFTDMMPLGELDVVFIAGASAAVAKELPENLKVIYLQDNENSRPNPPFDTIEYVPGVSEMFRKPLVREAKGAIVVPSPISVSLIVLFPLALHLLLNDTLTLKVEMPVYKDRGVETAVMEKKLEDLLHKVQLSFEKIAGIDVTHSSLLRTISVVAEFDSFVSKEEIEKIYNDVYDDHNFSFVLNEDPASTEVAATQKCLIFVSKPEEGKVRIRAIADSFMRGGAGDAIHSMNLLFGLYEKTGLSFPATMAFIHDEVAPEKM